MSTKEAMDAGSTSRRRGSAPKAGSVWETRMKSDQVKGGVKVFDATQENSDENKISSASSVNNTEVQDDVKVNMKPKRSPVGASGKRKTWKSESLEGSLLQIARQRSELGKNLDEQCKELSVSVDGNGNGNGKGIKKSPVQFKKTRSAVSSQKGTVEQSGDAIEKNSSQLRKVKSDSNETLTESKIEGRSESSDGNGDGNVNNSLQLQLVKAETAAAKKLDLEGFSEGTEKNPTGIDQSGSDQDCKELIVCEEKAITSTLSNVKMPSDDDFVDGEEEEEQDEEEIDKENEKSLDIKEITVQEPNPKKIVIEEKKLVHRNERSVPILKKQVSPAVSHARKIHTSPTKTKPSQVEDDFQRTPRSHSKLESFVDLVTWRDVSKSAFIFGIGTFVIISSSYTKDLNISFISVVSYLGLVYLASIFLFRSLIRRYRPCFIGSVQDTHMRGEIDRSQDYVVGEEEAIWVLKLVLPYINEFLLKLRALFSGDPSTTMKLAVLLFVLARCGSSITIWKMAKLGFFGVFIVPKVCSSYSAQLTAYGTFWIRRFRDAWESCSHKKAVGFAIFTLVWNLSSMVARIWAVFMLFVAFKYYQHSLMSNEWAGEEVRNEDPWQGRRTTLTQTGKQKKTF